jgi:hypothetical protein
LEEGFVGAHAAALAAGEDGGADWGKVLGHVDSPCAMMPGVRSLGKSTVWRDGR